MYKQPEFLKIDPSFLSEDEKELIARGKFDFTNKIREILIKFKNNLNDEMGVNFGGNYFIGTITDFNKHYQKPKFLDHWPIKVLSCIKKLEQIFNINISEISAINDQLEVVLRDIKISGFENKADFLFILVKR